MADSRNKPRTPVHWPRMKIRGARRKWKTSLRTTQVFRMYAVLDTHTEASGLHSYTFKATRKETPGARLIETKHTQDGWGRSVPTPKGKTSA